MFFVALKMYRWRRDSHYVSTGEILRVSIVALRSIDMIDKNMGQLVCVDTIRGRLVIL